MGIVTKIEVESTKATYELEDHTASMKGLWWLETDNTETPQIPPIKEGSYVKAYGSLRTQGGEKHFMVIKMFPVDDCNIITTHLLEVINTRLQAEALSKDTVSILNDCEKKIKLLCVCRKYKSRRITLEPI